MKESTLWQYLRNGLKNYPVHLTRIESSAGNGVPDVSVGITGKNLWVELKYIREWPKRPATKVKLPLRPEQKLWIKQRGSLSGDVWVFVRIGDDFFLLNWGDAIKACDGWTRDEWWDSITDRWYNRVDFDEFITVLGG